MTNQLTNQQIHDLNNMNVAAQRMELGNVIYTLVTECVKECVEGCCAKSHPELSDRDLPNQHPAASIVFEDGDDLQYKLDNLEIMGGGEGGDGIRKHPQLLDRNLPNQHLAVAVTFEDGDNLQYKYDTLEATLGSF